MMTPASVWPGLSTLPHFCKALQVLPAFVGHPTKINRLLTAKAQGFLASE
jgi:hypothetical protein